MITVVPPPGPFTAQPSRAGQCPSHETRPPSITRSQPPAPHLRRVITRALLQPCHPGRWLARAASRRPTPRTIQTGRPAWPSRMRRMPHWLGWLTAVSAAVAGGVFGCSQLGRASRRSALASTARWPEPVGVLRGSAVVAARLTVLWFVVPRLEPLARERHRASCQASGSIRRLPSWQG